MSTFAQDGFFAASLKGAPADQMIQIGPGIHLDQSDPNVWVIRTARQFREPLVGPLDGVNTTFLIQSRPNVLHPALIIEDGLVLEQGSQYTLDTQGQKITFTVAPTPSAKLSIIYWR